jgi:hypothetical protein
MYLRLAALHDFLQHPMHKKTRFTTTCAAFRIILQMFQMKASQSRRLVLVHFLSAFSPLTLTFNVSSKLEANKRRVHRKGCDILQTATTNPTISAAYDDRL